ncbi:MAG: adenosine-specific kinase [Deltaproteobacteria bacterium]|nr:adenosine-specific kinase [Deltaproteobacteria bacterium]
MELESVRAEFPEGTNIIIGAAHFIKTVEDLYEIIISSVPGARFGIAFSEASGPCLVRVEGTDEEMKRCAVRNSTAIGAGHCFVIVLKDAYPVNVLNAVKSCQEVCTVWCATANPLEVIVAKTAQGRGIIGTIDGYSPKGVEDEDARKARKELLRKFGYKL